MATSATFAIHRFELVRDMLRASGMPRKARLDIIGLVHHVMARGIEGREIFRNDLDRREFLRRLSEIVTKGRVHLYAWCLMSNHFHLLVRPEKMPLSWFMRRLMTGYAVVYNLRHKRKGHLFQNRYKSIVVEEDPYFLELVRYCHLNPVRTGIVSGIEELDRYPFTGHAVIMRKRDYLCQDRQGVLYRFAAKEARARSLYRKFIIEGFDQGVREELRGGGLIRSAGGMIGVLERNKKKLPKEVADERILGGGSFVETVIRKRDNFSQPIVTSVERILEETTRKWGLEAELIIGHSKNRDVARARREFLFRAHVETGASFTALGRLCNRSHFAIRKAVDKGCSEHGEWE